MKDYVEQKQHNLMPDKVAEITLDLHTQSKSGWIWGSLKQMIGIFAVAAECLFHFYKAFADTCVFLPWTPSMQDLAGCVS